MNFAINPGRQRSSGKGYLACTWLLGLFYGIYCAYSATDALYPLMDGAFSVSVSIVEAFVAAILPFLFFVFVRVSFVFILLLCFWKAFLLSFSAFSFLQLSCVAGWLIGMLALFRTMLSAPLFYFMLLRYFDAKRCLLWETAFCVSLIILIESVCYCIISPYLACLIIH